MHMIPLMIAGAGKIGRLIACLLADTKDYLVFLADCDFEAPETKVLLAVMPNIKPIVLDMSDARAIEHAVQKHHIGVVISSLPYFLNVQVAKAAKNASTHYFDLTEDINVSQDIQKLAKNAETAFVPHCGVAPGMISIIAHDLIQSFDSCHEVKLRVGALPQTTSNALHYSLTWSTDGLINEYTEPCIGLLERKKTELLPLEGLESIQIEGDEYEAFNTSGGLGGMCDVYQGQVDKLTYKTIRHVGHCEKMRFLLHDLRLSENSGLLKEILEHAIPRTYQDVVLLYVSVEGIKSGELIEESHVKKIFPNTIRGIQWSAIQLATASAVCAVMELALTEKPKLKGFVRQEHFELQAILANRFGKVYQ